MTQGGFMKKEAIICIITVTLIVVGHIILQSYSKKAIGETIYINVSNKNKKN